MPRRNLYDEVIKKKSPETKKVKYAYILKLYEEDFEHYDFKKMLRYLSLEWDCSIKEVILLSLKDAYLDNVKSKT